LKILIADDHTLFRESLSLALSRMEEGEPSIFQAEDSEHAVKIARLHHDLDLILMDIDMPGMSGLEAVRTLQKIVADVPVIMISANEDHHYITKAIELGAKGFVPKTTSTDIMLSALKLVLSGGTYLPPQLLTYHSDHDDSKAERGQLTPRQIEILHYLQKGVQNKIIAHELKLSESTVKVHIRRIFTLLGAKNRSQAVNNAMEMGIL